VAADTCAVTIAGELVYPHVGEWVEMVGSPTIREQGLYQEMLQSAMDYRDEGAIEARRQFDAQFEWFCGLMGKRTAAWSLTDDSGDPLPQPDGTAEPIRNLHTEEVYFLWNAYRGDVAAERKNGSSGSGATSENHRGQTTRSRSKRS
jgi:hypothetical protein